MYYKSFKKQNYIFYHWLFFFFSFKEIEYKVINAIDGADLTPTQYVGVSNPPSHSLIQNFNLNIGDCSLMKQVCFFDFTHIISYFFFSFQWHVFFLFISISFLGQCLPTLFTFRDSHKIHNCPKIIFSKRFGRVNSFIFQVSLTQKIQIEFNLYLIYYFFWI